jgi:hypothetical protein
MKQRPSQEGLCVYGVCGVLGPRLRAPLAVRIPRDFASSSVLPRCSWFQYGSVFSATCCQRPEIRGSNTPTTAGPIQRRWGAELGGPPVCRWSAATTRKEHSRRAAAEFEVTRKQQARRRATVS